MKVSKVLSSSSRNREKTDAIKSDGAVDDIPVPEEKRIINTEDILINTKIQRVDSINEDKIIENLKKDGGFSHKTQELSILL